MVLLLDSRTLSKYSTSMIMTYQLQGYLGILKTVT